MGGDRSFTYTDTHLFLFVTLIRVLLFALIPSKNPIKYNSEYILEAQKIVTSPYRYQYDPDTGTS